ncbi:MAG: phenylalanine--tRNA ligase subunit beta [bacterium]
MKISLNWLKQFVDMPKDITPEKLAEVLTLKTVEVEGVERQGKYLDNVVVGKIAKIEPHPNADKLKICSVDVGEKEMLQIVCGGINLRDGMFVAVAKIGAKVKWHGEEEIMMEKVKIRGEESNGMICAVAELGLDNIIKQEHEAEILDLEKYQVSSIKHKAGALLAEVLRFDDVVFDIDNKSITHRPDLWSHYGISREIAAIYGSKLAHGKPRQDLALKGDGADISVDIKDNDLCPRYMALAMSGIKIASSPQWMQNRLIAVGIRPINNIVDITNFVMLELGQPMHAFDKFKVQSSKFKVGLQVRRAIQGEKIKTLDKVERILDESMLVIADSEKPIAIAGVMGGANSEIDENTAEIILESANFEKINNRKTSAKLGLRTEASMRYEKGLDTNLCAEALARCVELIKDIIPNSIISSEVVDIWEGRSVPIIIEVSLDYIKKKMGIEIEAKKVAEILESLGFEVKHSVAPSIEGDLVFKITVPSWRATGDISIPDDIVEEVVRIYGYNNIKPKMPEVFLDPPLENKERILERRIKNILSIGFGMAETSNYSFVNEKQLDNLGMNEKCVKLANPLSSEHTLLRPSLIPNLLKNVKDNLRYFDEFAMFEIGSIFRDEVGDIEKFKVQKPVIRELNGSKSKIQEFLPFQEKFISGIVVESGKDKIPYYNAKEIIIGLLKELNIDCLIEQSNEIEENWMHQYRKSEIKNQKSKVIIGYISELNPSVAEKIGIKNARVGIFNLSLKVLLELSGEAVKYKPLPKYPSITRDLAVIVDKKVLYKDLADFIEETDKLITNVELFDIFENEKLGADKKSMAFHITFQSSERTLTDGEAEKIFTDIVENLEKKFGAEARK